MNKSGRIWYWFAFVLAIVLIALAGVTALVGRLEGRERQARIEAEQEQRFRLALWRLDAAVAVVLATENARPPADYTAPSILESGSPEPMRWHFQLGPGAEITSPRPSPVEHAALQRQLALPATNSTQVGSSPGSTQISPGRRERVYSNRERLATEANATPSQAPTVSPAVTQNLRNLNQAGRSQALQNQQELNARAANYDQVQKRSQYLNQVAVPQSGGNVFNRILSAETENISLLKPVWLGQELFLVRRYQPVPHIDRIQGVWVDWSLWSTQLAASVGDLLSDVRLIPVARDATGGEERRLVGLPVRIEAQVKDALSFSEPAEFWSPLKLALALAWFAVLAAAGSAAWLLWGTMALSERRASFVSAVTHELRTPLTTFKLYSEMLADDMVPDPTQRRSYLETLRAEATRLGHLVENVLTYARLERGRTDRPRETLTVDDLLVRIRERLDQRAAQAGISLSIFSGAVGNQQISVDIGLMEQVLFNLVDNACKYAGPAATGGRPSWIRIAADTLPRRRIALRVQDHGPGLADSVRRRLFEPFSKSADQAALGAPGVGLGLSLCRQLVRSMGGEVVLECSSPEGTSFRIELPTHSAETR